ncbi:uncharacterized protein LOC115964346 [Quercus lobata]|uniref:uncharacterized protein LOC115964346 n=1 Tax=Quercus lobata TaxID=97700 RepID=UPI0012457A3D|nr:uncharacterized protein LOC115964346 [Quercus lobata]
MPFFADPHAFHRHFHLVNQVDLETVLQAAVFVNDKDGQVRATHKILGYDPIQKSFVAPKHVIRANNPRLQKITVVEHGFLISEESPIPEGIPLASSSPSHQAAEDEGDLGLSEEGFGVFDQADPSEDPSGDLGDPDLSEAELLSMGTSSRAKMGLKRKPPTSLFDLIEGQPGKGAQGKSQSNVPTSPPQIQPVKNRSSPSRSQPQSPRPKLPAPPQSALPPRPKPTGPKRKRSPKGKEPMNGGKSQSSQEEDEAPRAQKQLKIGHQGQGKGIDAQSTSSAWLPAPMLHREPLMEDVSMRNLRDGEGTYVADALKSALLLPTDMEKMKNMRMQEIFLSVKRYLGMAVQTTYRMEEEAKGQSKIAELERNKRIEAARTLKNSEAGLAKAREDLKEVTKARDSAEAGLTGAQKQAEEQTRRLLATEEQLEIAKEQISDLKKKLIEADNAKGMAEWARDEAVRAKTEAEFAKTEAETNKD